MRDAEQCVPTMELTDARMIMILLDILNVESAQLAGKPDSSAVN